MALRGKEVMQDIIFESTDLIIDSLLVTPIGICLNFYEESNNFVFVRFNGDKIKLYNNGNLTVMDAAMQTDFTSNGFFPKSGKSLEFTVNGKSRMARGEMGEPAVILVNGEVANLNSAIKEGDEINVTESTAGAPAKMTVGELPEYKSIIKVNISGTVVEMPKFATVNGELQSEYYEIASGDEIAILDYYTVEQVIRFLDLDPTNKLFKVNNMNAAMDTKVYENFSVTWEEGLPEHFADYVKATEEDEEEETAEPDEDNSGNEVVTKKDVTDKADSTNDTETTGDAEAASVDNTPKSFYVTANGIPVKLSGKSEYVYVDIFDYISFDRTKARGNLVTRINGRTAVYMEELHEGDALEVYWE